MRRLVADLDGILGQCLNPDVLQEICDCGVDVIQDVGVITVTDIDRLRQRLNCRIVVASETSRQIDELIFGWIAEYLVFSVDLKSGVVQIADARYSEADPETRVGQRSAAGLEDVIVLEMAAVDTGRGISTLDLCRSLRASVPNVGLITGGGVHSPGCIQDAHDAGADRLLIASPIHDGRFSDWQQNQR